MEKNKAGKRVEKDRNSTYMLNNVVRESLTKEVTKKQRM